MAATCTPSSVKVCGVADDSMTVWINGYQIGGANAFMFAPLNYTPTPSSTPTYLVTSPVCVTSTDPGLLASLTSGTNVLGAQVNNNAIYQIFGNWWVDIACNGGQHSYVISDGANTSVYRSDTADWAMS